MIIPNKLNILLPVLIFISAVIVYIPSLRNDFVWDDEEVIEKSYFLFNSYSLHNIFIPYNMETKKAKYYRPVHFASIVFDKFVWGVNSFGFHFTNILIHALNSVLFFYLFRLVLKEFNDKKREFTSLTGSVLFILHPIHTESVSWVAGRTDMICTFFFLTALLTHIYTNNRKYLLLLTLISYSLSLLSKELAIAFPLVVISFDYLTGTLNKQKIVTYISYILITSVYLMIRARAFINLPDIVIAGSSTAQTDFISNTVEIIIILINTYFFYFYKLLFPIDLNAFTALVPQESFYTISSVITLLSATALVFYYGIKKHKALIFYYLFIVITLSPSATVALSNIAATPVAERYLYLPSVGFVFMMSYLIVKLRDKMELKYINTLLFVVGLFYLIVTIGRQEVWSSSLNLWKDASQKSYLSPLTHTNYGAALMDNGRYEEAIEEFKIALSPDLTDSARGRAITSINMGNLYINLGQYETAEKWFVKANIFDPNYGRTYYHLGLINYIKAEISSTPQYYNKAEDYLLQTFKYYHSYSKAHLLLAKVYQGLGKYAEAKMHASKAIKTGIPQNLSEEAYDILEIDHDTGAKNP